MSPIPSDARCARVTCGERYEHPVHDYYPMAPERTWTGQPTHAFVSRTTDTLPAVAPTRVDEAPEGEPIATDLGDKTENVQPQEPPLSQDATMRHDATIADNTPARDASALKDENARLVLGIERARIALQRVEGTANVQKQLFDLVYPDTQRKPDAPVSIDADWMEMVLRRHAAMYDWSKREASAINDFILTVRYGVAEEVRERGGTLVTAPMPKALGGCLCYLKAPTVPVYRDRMDHLSDCPAKGSGYPVGAF